jgi:hypothetical protein
MKKNNEAHRKGRKERKEDIKGSWARTGRSRLFFFYSFALCAFFVYFEFFVVKSAILDDKSITSNLFCFLERHP